MALKVQLGRIPVDWVIDPTLVDLAQFRHNVCSSYENDSSLGFLNDTVEFIRDRPFGRVFQAAERGSAEDCLDVGNRTFIGYGTQRDQDRALEYWKRLVDSSHLRHPSTPVSNSIRAQAHSCISNYWFDRRIVSNIEGWNIDSLYRSASNANTAASLGLIAPCVLAVADAAEKAGLRRPEDNRFAGLCTKRFQILRSLWEASDKHKREISEAKRTRDRKVEKTPLAYVCAALGCGIEGTKKAALSRCGGKCPVDKKPSYCSKECQIRVRYMFPLLCSVTR
ncbi:hypothetical protein JAAARDRAFT_62033 [Jaapia argillacea MUCL 33604]|uniref:MYND-type domain-containing protein n=1 Tax=Jaapia argillacea MUCL 33604 TaxID=933084 RepID=A0A067PEJ1_9AGAM|nr:hypothetical protein JAAARDRAFT_62033 [Jaapia argillacea MUCL 33604]